ncbi:MAG: tyrosine-type recombinase/integrase [Sphaerochaetaceae bacterium]
METKAQENRREIDDYLQYIKSVRLLSERTVTAYACDLAKLGTFLKERDMGVYEVVFEDARRFSAFLLGHYHAPASINRTLAAVRNFYLHAFRTGHCASNPFSRINGTPRGRRLPSVLSKEEVQLVIGQPYVDFPAFRDIMMFNLFYSTGCRLSELLAIGLQDIDRPEMRILVHGKGSRERYVFLTPKTARMLDGYLPQREAWQLAHGVKNPSDRQALMLNLHGKRLSASSVHSIFRKYQLKLGIQKRFTPHVFRHSFATHMLDNDSGIRIVQELLGHASISTTQIYSHVSNERLRRVYERSHPHGRKEK